MGITPNYDLDIDTSLGGSNASDYVIPSQKAIKAYVDNNSGTPSNMVTTDTAQDITQPKTFIGQKLILFKQATSSNKLGFTLYNNSGTEKGYLEFNPSNTVDSVPLMTLGNYATAAAGLTHVGFRKYSSVSGASGAYNLLAPLISDARTPFSLTTTYTNFYLPLGFTDGNTTVLTAKTGLVDISSLLPTVPTVNNATITFTQGGTTKGTITLNQANNDTIALDAGGGTVDQTYDDTSANAQSGVAIAGAGFLTSTDLADELSSGDYTADFDYLSINSKRVATQNWVNSLYADKTLSNVSSSDIITSLGYTPANNTDIDGSWTFLNPVISICSSQSVNGSGTVDFALTSVLPNDGELYKMQLACYGETGTASGNRVQLTFSSTGLQYNGNFTVFDVIARSAARVFASNTVLLCAKYTDTIKIIKNSTYTGTVTINCIAYRKVR